MAYVVDSFNRADSASSLGTTSDGLATWVSLSGTHGISSNRAYKPGTSGSPDIAYIPLGDADGTVQVTLAVVDSAGIAFRVQDINNYWYLRYNTGTTALLLGKVVSGSFIAPTSIAGSVANGDTIALVLSGSSITAQHNGATVGSVSDSFLSTATKHGLQSVVTTARWDDFSAGTPTSPTPWRRPAIAVRSRALTRAAVI